MRRLPSIERVEPSRWTPTRFDLPDDRALRPALATLPDHVQQRARQAYRLFRDDPRHPSLRFKQVHATRPIYSARVGLGYRAPAKRRPPVVSGRTPRAVASTHPEKRALDRSGAPGAPRWNRTINLLIKSQLLCQLS